MRFFEIKGGIQIPLSIEERRLVEEIDKQNKVLATDLDERDETLARQLVSRGALTMIENEDETITFQVNKLEELWRD